MLVLALLCPHLPSQSMLLIAAIMTFLKCKYIHIIFLFRFLHWLSVWQGFSCGSSLPHQPHFLPRAHVAVLSPPQRWKVTCFLIFSSLFLVCLLSDSSPNQLLFIHQDPAQIITPCETCTDVYPLSVPSRNVPFLQLSYHRLLFL